MNIGDKIEVNIQYHQALAGMKGIIKDYEYSDNKSRLLVEFDNIFNGGHSGTSGKGACKPGTGYYIPTKNLKLLAPKELCDYPLYN